MSQEEESKEYDVSTLTWRNYAGGLLANEVIPIKNGVRVTFPLYDGFQLRDTTGNNRVTPNVQYTKDYTLLPELAPNGFKVWFYKRSSGHPTETEILENLTITYL